MPNILIRNLSPERIAFWKKRAASRGRSMQAEIDALLAEEERRERRQRDFIERSDAFREKLRGRHFLDSAELIREDRDSGHGREVD